ncbi:MAG: hypothetical protein IJ104_04525 [Methanobrevibacter sp.]|nr:hypothetical protein [Methanobrevibacter sp.]
MAIKVLKKIDPKEACLNLEKNPQKLKIISITPIKQTTYNPEKFYFYINFLMEDGSKFGISYTFDLVDNDEYECTTYSKLFVLVKKFLKINEENCSGLHFAKNDLHTLLVKKEFLATAEFREAYGKTVPYIIVKKIL